MKKDRNSFFQSSNFNMSASTNTPMMPNGMMGNMAPMPNGMMPNMNATGGAYYGMNSMTPGTMPNYMPSPGVNASEIEARLAKLERAINRLDARISKLEGTTFYSKDTYESDGNMYMV